MPFPTVPNARPMPIDDNVLAQLRRVAHDAWHGNTTPAEGEWLLSACEPLLNELAARRHAMAAMAGGDGPAFGTIHPLSVAR